MDAPNRQVRLNPYLPDWLPWLRLKGLPAGSGRFDLRVEGHGRSVQAEADGLPAGWTLQVGTDGR